MEKGNYIIIGGSSGIGLATAKLLVDKGHSVFASYNSTYPDNSASSIDYFKYDVLSDEYPLNELPQEISGMVYCPGAIHLKPFHRIKPEQFLIDYQLQVVGAVKVIQALLPRLKAAQSSSIVLFSTVAVQRGFTFHSMVSASKGAIEGLTKALAAELAPQIRVNCIAPSLTDTPLAAKLLSNPEKRQNSAQRHPLKRVGTPKDMAKAAGYLLSNEAAWITGQVLKVDGGLSSIVQ